MITSFAQFLEALQAKEAAILAEQEVTHAPTIGEMYEGLIRELVERAILEARGLRLLDGFVAGVDGKLSPQIDAMLVVGERVSAFPKPISGLGRSKTCSSSLKSRRTYMRPT